MKPETQTLLIAILTKHPDLGLQVIATAPLTLDDADVVDQMAAKKAAFDDLKSMIPPV